MDWAAENYALVVGGDETLFTRLLSHGHYQANAVAPGYIAQEAAPYKVEPTMTSRGIPPLDYLVQTHGHSTTFVGQFGKPLVIDRYAVRGLGENAIADSLTSHRFWIAMDYYQHKGFLAIGYLCPNLRAYETMMPEIKDAKKHYPQGEYEMFVLRM